MLIKLYKCEKAKKPSRDQCPWVEIIDGEEMTQVLHREKQGGQPLGGHVSGGLSPTGAWNSICTITLLRYGQRENLCVLVQESVI